MKSTSAIHPAIMENMKDSLVKCTPHILMRESHNASISAMLNSFHNITAVRSVSAIFLSHTELTANRHLYAFVKKEWEHKRVQR